jgi:hypothetical protein
MKKFISKFKNANKFNRKIIKREYDKDLVEYVINVFKSLESTRFIKLLDYKVEYDESKIDYNKHITSRRKTRKKNKNIKYHFIKDTRVFELTISFKLDVHGEVKYITKSILLPKADKNGYYILKGKRYLLLYQLVDSSTYVVKEGLVFKSLMPITVNFRTSTIKELRGQEYTFTSFYMKLFKRQISVMLFYFSKLGFYNSLKYFIMDQFITAVEPKSVDLEDEENLYFNANRYVVIKVNKEFFDRFDYVKAMTAMVIECFAAKTNFDNLDNHNYWIEQLGALYTKTPYKMHESGRSTIVFFERLLDLTSKGSLKVSEINKLSIYSVVRWMISNFAELRQKNNLDLSTKRLRLNEYIASLLSIRIGESVSRVLTYGNNIELKQVQRYIFNFSGTIVLQSLHNSQLLKFDDLVNDLDVFSSLKYTINFSGLIG